MHSIKHPNSGLGRMGSGRCVTPGGNGAGSGGGLVGEAGVDGPDSQE